MKLKTSCAFLSPVKNQMSSTDTPYLSADKQLCWQKSVLSRSMAWTQRIKKTMQREHGNRRGSYGWETFSQNSSHGLGFFCMGIIPVLGSSRQQLGCESKHKICSMDYGSKERFYIIESTCYSWSAMCSFRLRAANNVLYYLSPIVSAV